MLFSQLCDRAADFHSPLICTSGQLQVAVLRLLDLLAAGGTSFFYAGDFDVGGLSIASRLLDRYPGQLSLWHMSLEDYDLCRSEIPIDAARLNALERGVHPAQTQLLSVLREKEWAGYQELLLPKLLHDLTVTPYQRIAVPDRKFETASSAPTRVLRSARDQGAAHRRMQSRHKRSVREAGLFLTGA